VPSDGPILPRRGPRRKRDRGLGGMGGAQPLAATLAGATSLIADVDPMRVRRRHETGYVEIVETDLDRAIDGVRRFKKEGRAVSIGVVANVVDLLERLTTLGFVPDLVTDQTSAHDPYNGYVPQGMSLTDALVARTDAPEVYVARARATMKTHVELMAAMADKGAHVFDYGNNLRAEAVNGGLDTARAFSFPGFVPAYIRPRFCRGEGPFRWVALSGDPDDIFTTDKALLEAFPDNPSVQNWLRRGAPRIQFQGLPSRICWLGMGERAKAGALLNDLVASGKVSAPIVIGRDHLDCGSVASPNRETEAMKDGSDAVSDWVFLNALINAVGGASWVSVHHGGGVGMGYSQHAGMVIVADGTAKAAARIARVLTTDPAMGVLRHADAGYDEALETAATHGVRLPMREYE